MGRFDDFLFLQKKCVTNIGFGHILILSYFKIDMKKVVVAIIFVFFSLVIGRSEEKVFIKDYYYQASENDSKVSSRQKALNEVKLQILEEIGTYIESYVNYAVTEDSKKVSSTFFEQEIRQITVGRLEVKVLEESWNGVEYYIRAEVVVDPDEILEQLHRTIQNRQASVVIDSLNLLLSSQQGQIVAQNGTINRLNEELNAKQKEMAEQQKRVSALEKELVALNSQYVEYQQQQKVLEDEIERIGNKFKQMGQNAREKARLGMTISEVKKILGNPRLTDGIPDSAFFMNYGSVWLLFQSQVLVKGFDSKYWRGDNQFYYDGTPNVIKSF